MKKTFFAIMMATLAFTASAQEQNGERPERQKLSQEEMLQKQTDRMAEELGLDDAQKASVLELNTEYAGKLGRPMMRRPEGEGGPEGAPDSLRAPRPSREEMDAQMKEQRETQEAYNAELKKILTDEQFAKYEEAQKRQGPHGHGRGNGPGPQGQPPVPENAAE